MKPHDKEFRSEDILAEIRSSLHSRKIIDVEEEQIKMVFFRAGGQTLAFYGRNVLEILTSREIYPVPFLPDHIPGLINVRGDIEAVMDISRLLGGQTTNHDNGMIIMIQHGTFKSGVMVDSVEDVLDVPLASIKPPLNTLTGIIHDLITGSVDFSGQTVAILDTEKLASRLIP